LTYVTPVYNGSAYIEGVIASVAAQRSANGSRYRHVIVDDGSTDGTWELLERATADSGGLLTAIHKTNGGEASAVNRAMEEIVTPYVCTVNADDPLLDGHGQSMTAALDADSDVVVAYPDWLMIDSQGEVLLTRKTKPYDIRALVGDFVCLPGPGAVIRRSALRGPMRNPRYRYVSDFELWVRLAPIGPFVRVSEVLATWRRHDAGATATGAGTRIAEELLRLAEEDLPNLLGPDLQRRHGRSARAHARYYAALQLAGEDPWRARRLIVSSIAAKPLPSIGYDTDHRHPVGIVLAMSGRGGSRLLKWAGRIRRRVTRQ
jgi:glycosyltransferase involved in cell wall biosynthesis